MIATSLIYLRGEFAQNRRANEANERHSRARERERRILIDLLDLSAGLRICDVAAAGCPSDGIRERLAGDCRIVCLEISPGFRFLLPDLRELCPGITVSAVGTAVVPAKFRRTPFGPARGRMPHTTRLAHVTTDVVAVVISFVLCAPLVSDRAWAGLGDCSQPVTSGESPTASDCLFILNVAVGLATCTPECICAPKGSLPVSATDALVCLQVAVGQAVDLDCPCDGTTTTTVSPGTTTTTLFPSTTTTTLSPATTTTTTTSVTTTTLPLQCPVFSLPPTQTLLPSQWLEGQSGVILECECVSEFGAACDGTCPDQEACIPDFELQECFCRALGCGDYMGAPQCYGLCDSGQSCVDVDGVCDCVTLPTTCGGGQAPTCDGACPSGQFCRELEGNCVCADVTCGGFAGSPLCLGLCPPGQACIDTDGTCSCASESE